ncbi:MAG: hypothetical protein AVDCRST_MAG57-1724 [uncultured Blastococcus sp.]|uniref:Uncharacterized protein n=1 Tax=uncultured Blastococcus sp. TaxID=217144 RepID=A0A6J4I9Q4_9ACTN|nr:MAG: hypothetical protein AVDCRST_MAG57-1724 [uncultured Blastococcus sp.]
MQQSSAVAPPRVRRGLPAWDRLRLGLLAVWLVLAVASVALGQRETPLADLEAAVAQGRVDSVLVLGRAVPPEQGYSTQSVQWRDGLVRRTAEARVGGLPVGGRPDVPSRGEDLGVLLSRADPDLQVRRSDQAPLWSSGELLGWQVPTWVSLIAVVTFLLQLGHLVGVPQTWRATRWAWFWVTTVPVVGTVTMLLLSGRTPGLPAPSAGSRRLTGGWAFLLSSAATSLLSGVTTTGGT